MLDAKNNDATLLSMAPLTIWIISRLHFFSVFEELGQSEVG